MNFAIRIVLILFLSGILSSCFNRELRGKIRKSDDNKTYLVIEKDCGVDNSILVDGQIWPYKIGEKGEISPGEHNLNCGGELRITIRKGTVYHLDYWGP